jgi:exosome complex component CSL4
MNVNMTKKEVAIPGALVATTEEYSAAPSKEGVIEEEGGVYSSKLGAIDVDAAHRTVSVKPAKALRLLRVGDLVVARVENIYKNTALVKIERMIAPAGQRIALGSASAFLRISELGFYAEKFRDAVKIGDLILARVTELSQLANYVTMSGPDLGVVKAFCSKCRSELKQQGVEMVCASCGNRELRKVAGAPLPPGMEPRRAPMGGGRGGFGRERGGFRGRGGGGRFPDRGRPPFRERGEHGEGGERGHGGPGFGPRRKKIYGPRISKNID